MNKVQFVDDLPTRSHPGYDELCANPGQWAEYWGSVRSVYTICRKTSRHGFRFEGVMRNGKGYIRAVKL